jgi:hypothetical protein
MRGIALCVLVLGFLVFPWSPVFGRAQVPARDEPVTIHDGFLTGQQFRDLPESARKFYAAGVVDGAFLAPLFGAPKPRLQWLETCAVGMTDIQVAAIILKFLSDNPGRWHQPVHASAYAALLQACPKGTAN